MSVAARFRSLGTACLAALPLLMALANRSSPLFVGLAALAFLIAALIEEREDLAATLLEPLATPLGASALAFLGWCLVSIAWSPFPALSWRVAGEFLPTVLAAYLLARLAPGRLSGFALPLAVAATAAASLYIAVGMLGGLPVQKALGMRVAEFVFNRPVLTLLLIASPLAYAAIRRGWRLAGIAVLAFALLAVLASVSGAARLGLAASLAGALAARFLPRPAALGLAGLGLGLCVALAPVEGDVLARFMPEAAHERLVQSSSRARVAIARSFGAAVAEDPWRGAGYGTAARFAETGVAQRLDPEMRELLPVGHPHNSFLQVWAELGLPGAFLAGLALMLMLRAVAGYPPGAFAAAIGLAAAAAAVAFVEHGAWQGWWTAGLGAAITWLRHGLAGAETGTRP
ncbi:MULTISPECIES: O-antigen ligase family protein [Methylobacterium]|uniref:O-antigen ligase-related domain-containing protein n=3 Tax=Pseudomonadota TaxID=1224 RepID=A0ABQ4SZC6_9HYPH|nr:MULTISPECIES: O-antigen ligase family protein [Methylobacterium]GJE07011.1 hypothetical protein AOPFMNJM_2335 [Methylobacterium jeotgali]